MDNNESYNSPDNFRAELQRHAEQMFNPAPEPVDAPVEQPMPEMPQMEMPVEQPQMVDDGKPKFEDNKVPQSRFSEEVQKRRELEAKFEEERIARIKLEAQLEAIRPRETESTKPAIDPLDYESHSYLEQKIDSVAKENEQLKQMLARQEEERKISSYVQNQEKAFEVATPDYHQAIDYLKQVENRMASHMFDDQNQASNFISAKYDAIVKNAVRSGKNPSEVVYNLAKAAGYTPVPAAPRTNLSQLEANMTKSATIPTGYSPPVAGGITSFEQTLKNGKVDKDLFRKALEYGANQLKY